jgi:arylsulfatase A-like enzyme
VLVLACLFFGIGTQAAAFFKAEGADSADTAKTVRSKPDVVLDRGREKTEAGTPQSRGRPNVILILADDLDKSVFSRTTFDSAWVTEGASFSNALATTSLCCPSRASILKGQYAHNTGLVNNENFEPGGGAQYFSEEGLDQRTLATLLKGGGYETWFGGKYLNGYEAAGGAAAMSRRDGTAGKPTFIPTKPT